MKVLFLDIDGVVNCQSTTQRHRGFIGIDPYMAFMVGKIQLDTDCKVVLSSSWRSSKDGIDEVESQVVKIIDCTPSSWYDREKDHHSTRGEEIQKWLDAHPEVLKYAILDDDSDMLPEQERNFFKTTWLRGITEEIAKAVTDHLTYPKCLHCKRELVPALDCKNYVTGRWDEHSYICECFPDKNLRLSIG